MAPHHRTLAAALALAALPAVAQYRTPVPILPPTPTPHPPDSGGVVIEGPHGTTPW